MAFIMFAAIGMLDNNWKKFTLFTIVAGMVHSPAFVFLPAYAFTKLKQARSIILLYLVMLAAVFLFRSQIVTMMADLYYEGERYAGVPGGLGGKTVFMIALLVVGCLLCGFSDGVFRKLFLLISIASLLQVFSVYDHVFTRLADYYFQFLILYAPCMLAQVHREPEVPVLYFTRRSQGYLAAAFVVLALVYYQQVSMAPPASAVDNLIANFKFMWQ